MIAVISDIHGNAWALRAVLQELDRLRPALVAVGGDLAFGGPAPAECVELIRRRGYPAIRGNTDEWVTDPAAAPDPISRWASERLGDAQRRYVASLPFLWRYAQGARGDLVVVHATPWSITEVVPPDAGPLLVERVFQEANAAAVVYGHIHVAHQRRADSRLLVNAGSVGMPFDGDQRASFATLEETPEGWSAQIHRIPYDVDAAARASRKSDNPGGDRYARRLETAQFGL